MYAKATGIVLHRVRYAEASLIVTWYTRERGRVRTVAKGALGSRSRLRAALDLFSVCNVVFHDRPGADLHILREADLRKSYAGLASDLDAYHAGLYVLELLSVGTQDDLPEERLYAAALAALDRLSSGYRHEHVLRFERAILEALGRRPSDVCAQCRRRIAAVAGVVWNPSDTSFTCDTCSPTRARALPVGALRWWHGQQDTLSDPEAVALGVVTGSALDHAIERRPRTRRHVPVHR